MDRPIPVSDLQLLVGGNCRCVEASYPPDLEARVAAQLAAWAGAPPDYPYLQSWEVAGGGAGGKWRVNLQLGRGVDWGLNTSLPSGIAHFVCREAAHFEQLTAVQNQMLIAITAAFPNAAVWGTKIAASGRDGTFLVAMMYTEGLGDRPTSHVYSPELQANLDADTALAGLGISACYGADASNGRTYMLLYSMEVSDDIAAATGVVAALFAGGAPLFQDEWAAAAAAEWRTFSGHHYVEQDPAGPQQFTLHVIPGAGNTVSVRQIRIDATLICHQNAFA